VLERLLERLAGSGRTRGGEADFMAVQDVTWQGQKRNRERDECRAKLLQLGLLADEGDTAVNAGTESTTEGVDA
jgi:hypothetical protein